MAFVQCTHIYRRICIRSEKGRYNYHSVTLLLNYMNVKIFNKQSLCSNRKVIPSKSIFGIIQIECVYFFGIYL